jgi:hypothetical protein
MFSGSVKMVGKMRIRLSTLRANTPLNLSMPLQGELVFTLRPAYRLALFIHKLDVTQKKTSPIHYVH